MGEKIVVGPIAKGLVNNLLPFAIDNNAFPQLMNAYPWRGRIKRKRGTELLGRLQRYFISTSLAYSPNALTTLPDDGMGNGVGTLMFSFPILNGIGVIEPGSVILTDTTTGDVYTDPAADGILVGTPAGSGTIIYNQGHIFITGAAGHNLEAIFFYYPALPVMGLEDFISNSVQFPGTIAFDTVYSYDIMNVYPYGIYDVSWYKNPPVTAGFFNRLPL